MNYKTYKVITMPLIISATGHRPQALQTSWSMYESFTLPRLTDLATAYFQRTKPDIVISGMALGWDTAVALSALTLGIELHCYVPFNGHHARWSSKQQEQYHSIIQQTDKVIYPQGEDVPRERSYSEVAKLLLNRNTDMLNNSNRVVALFNGEPKGGTYDAIKKAKAMGLQVDNLYNSWVKYRHKKSSVSV